MPKKRQRLIFAVQREGFYRASQQLYPMEWEKIEQAKKQKVPPGGGGYSEED